MPRYDNMIATNLLGRMVNPDSLEQLFFNYDTALVSKDLRNVGITNSEFADILDKMSYNATATTPVDVQSDLMKLFLRSNPSLEQAEDFRLNADSPLVDTTLLEYSNNMKEEYAKGRTM